MPKVVGLDTARQHRAIDELEPMLALALETRGMLTVNADELDDVDAWRRIARAAARRLGIAVRTGISPQGVVWVADNRPPSAELEADLVDGMEQVMARRTVVAKPPALRLVVDDSEV